MYIADSIDYLLSLLPTLHALSEMEYELDQCELGFGPDINDAVWCSQLAVNTVLVSA